MDRNKPLFSNKEQLSIIQKYGSQLGSLLAAKSTKEWNELREALNGTFRGSEKERLMLFGYIDGVLRQQNLKFLRIE